MLTYRDGDDYIGKVTATSIIKRWINESFFPIELILVIGKLVALRNVAVPRNGETKWLRDLQKTKLEVLDRKKIFGRNHKNYRHYILFLFAVAVVGGLPTPTQTPTSIPTPTNQVSCSLPIDLPPLNKSGLFAANHISHFCTLQLVTLLK